MSTPVVVSIVAGAFLGRLAAGWAAQILNDIPATKLANCPNCQTACSGRLKWLSLGSGRCQDCGQKWQVWWPVFAAFGLAALFGVYAWLLTSQHCQDVSEVRPATAMYALRLPFHLVLLFLLTVATLTDLLDYVISDDVVIIGILVAVIGATVSGDLQVIHVWVNWDHEVAGLRGPYLPEWMKHHWHWHGLVWSLAGMAVGSSYVWFVRTISGWILGQQTMGLGDVTLMAMIGAFIGWQPALCAIAIAPVTAIVVGLIVRVITGRTFVAFGPYLAVSAVIVLCTWRWIWAEPLLLRVVFSHWPSIAGMVGGSLVALAILLGGLRLFLEIPADAIRR
jgi:leader peptidase (prepilin peptidase)/N-methyltransferase